MWGCLDGEKMWRRRGAANRKLYALRVKGQPPRSGQVATVGTDQSQCHNHIDRLWTHTGILSDVHTYKTAFLRCHGEVSALCVFTHSHSKHRKHASSFSSKRGAVVGNIAANEKKHSSVINQLTASRTNLRLLNSLQITIFLQTPLLTTQHWPTLTGTRGRKDWCPY